MITKSIIVGSCFFILYLFTLAPSYLWSDSAKLALFVHERFFLGISYNYHPMHTLIGYLFSFLPFSLAYTQNLMSAFFAFLTILLLHYFCYQETQNFFAATLSSGAFAISHLFWLYSVINETYSMVTFFLISIIVLARSYYRNQQIWKLYLISFLVGCAYSTHGMSILFLPGLLLLIWNNHIKKVLFSYHPFLFILMFFLGSSLIFIVPLFKGFSVATLLKSLIYDMQMHKELFAASIKKFSKEFIRYPLYLMYQFPSPILIFGVYGFIKVWKKFNINYAMALFLLWFIPFIFSLFYFFQRQFAMLIPTFLIYSIWAAYGIAFTYEKWFICKNYKIIILLSILILLLPPFEYYGAYRLAEKENIMLPIRELPYRNNYKYFLFPPKNNEYGAVKYVQDAFRQASKNSIILADFNPAMALLYAQKVFDFRKDILIDIQIDKWFYKSKDPAKSILDYLEFQIIKNKRTVYLADIYAKYYHPEVIRTKFELIQESGPLWLVKAKALIRYPQ